MKEGIERFLDQKLGVWTPDDAQRALGVLSKTMS
jgi:hypothetical protein